MGDTTMYASRTDAGFTSGAPMPTLNADALLGEFVRLGIDVQAYTFDSRSDGMLSVWAQFDGHGNVLLIAETAF